MAKIYNEDQIHGVLLSRFILRNMREKDKREKLSNAQS